MTAPVISDQDKEALLSLVTAGELRVKIDYGRWTIEFNMASAGSESQAEVYILRANGGVYNDGMKKLAVLANNITRIGSLDMTALSFGARFEELMKMQPQMRDFLWEAYMKFRGAQDVKFQAFIEDSKKSLESQLSAITGSSTAPAAE